MLFGDCMKAFNSSTLQQVSRASTLCLVNNMFDYRFGIEFIGEGRFMHSGKNGIQICIFFRMENAEQELNEMCWLS